MALSLVLSSSGFAPQAGMHCAASRASQSSYVMAAPDEFTLAVLGDLHLDPRDLDHSYLGRDHFNEIFDETDSGKFVVLSVTSVSPRTALAAARCLRARPSASSFREIFSTALMRPSMSSAATTT